MAIELTQTVVFHVRKRVIGLPPYDKIYLTRLQQFFIFSLFNLNLY